MSEPSVGEFRAGVRAWLDAHDLSPAADGAARPILDGQVAQLLRVRAALYDAGWMRYGWPASLAGSAGWRCCGRCWARRSAGTWPSRDLFHDRGACADDDRLRPAGPGRVGGAVAAERAGAVVPGVLRARLGERPGSLSTRAVAARWVLDRHRAEGVDVARAVRGPVRAADADVAGARAGSPRSSWICRRPVSPSGRCGRCTGWTSSPRCSSTLWWFLATGCWGGPVMAGGWRRTCCRSSGRPASGTGSRTCTRGWTGCSAPRLPRAGRWPAAGPMSWLSGPSYVALHTLRCRSLATQRRLADGGCWGRRRRSTRCCWPRPSSSCTTPPGTCCPGWSS